MMRTFYEKKLNDLQSALAERESERDRLLEELEAAKDQHGTSEELKQRLDEKEQQIEALKNMQRDYQRQTAVASKSAADLSKLIQLQNDVKNMKKRKADMQKELAQEKRVHARDVTRLNKVVSQKEREISKIKRESTQHEIEASKAKAVSKNRYEELSQLRKTLKQYKKEIGLDPVLLGRRHSATNQPSNREVDFNTLREYFDMKVAGVVRKEALVDKLATEWEEYFELQTQVDATDPVKDQDGLGTLRMKMDFVNDKIRKTAKRLRKDSGEIQESAKQPATEKADALLFGKDFVQLCTGKFDCFGERMPNVSARL
jgi:DNA repair exonuclease SbcCD ATPase subunit